MACVAEIAGNIGAVFSVGGEQIITRMLADSEADDVGDTQGYDVYLAKAPAIVHEFARIQQASGVARLLLKLLPVAVQL